MVAGLTVPLDRAIPGGSRRVDASIDALGGRPTRRLSPASDKIRAVSTHAEATPAHYELAYEEAKRALDAQESVVNELRTRSGILIANAAVTTSFFGGRALEDGEIAAAGWVAIACFAVVGRASSRCCGRERTGRSPSTPGASSGRTSKAKTGHCRSRRSTGTWRCT